MRLLVSGATVDVARLAPKHPNILGVLAVPAARNSPESVAATGLPVAADNGCFNGLDSGAFVLMLNAYREASVKLDWVAVPDVVGDCNATVRQWMRWEPVVRAFEFRPCFVCQDGCDLQLLHDINPKAIFIGGSTDWKLGPQAARCVKWARKQRRPAHMGRVNTERRIRYAVEIGCTSCDGSGFSKWPKRIPLGLKWICRAMRENLFTAQIRGEL